MTPAPSPLPAELERKLRSLHADDAARASATALLADVLAKVEGERVALAALKLAGADLDALARWVRAAREDYRDVLAWAEYPRQMRLGPDAPLAEQARARREDAAEYARWLQAP